jgi:hypothetical protein
MRVDRSAIGLGTVVRINARLGGTFSVVRFRFASFRSVAQAVRPVPRDGRERQYFAQNHSVPSAVGPALLGPRGCGQPFLWRPFLLTPGGSLERQSSAPYFERVGSLVVPGTLEDASGSGVLSRRRRFNRARDGPRLGAWVRIAPRPTARDDFQKRIWRWRSIAARERPKRWRFASRIARAVPSGS